MKRTIHLIPVLLIVGFSGIVAQTILLRELLIIFSGNELSIGVIIGSWVIWEAAGAYLGGRRKESPHNNSGLFIVSMILFSFFFTATIYGIRIAKVLAGIPPEIGAGIMPILYMSFSVLLPAGLLHGFVFTLMCTIHDQATGEGPSSVGKVYFYETLGTVLGGACVNYLFIPYLQSFQIALSMAVLNGIACLFISLPFFERKRALQATAGLLCVIIPSAMLIGGSADRMHRDAIRRQWQGKNVVHYANTLYQNIVVMESYGQYTFFSDGIPLITTPVPDIAFVEEFVHFPMLHHSSPEKILVLHGGAGGVIKEILKYPTVKQVDYVETDPLLLKTIKRFPTDMTRKELGSPLVRLHFTDGRIFVKKRQAQYDVVLLGLPPPSTLRVNRFFTHEFFDSVKGALKKRGIFAFTINGSFTYYSKELKDLNSCILNTLSGVFPNFFVIPGDANLVLASPSADTFYCSPSALYGRIVRYGFKTDLISLPHLTYRLDEDRRNWFMSSIKTPDKQVNRDLAPAGLFLNIVYQNILFTPSLKKPLELLRGIDLPALSIFLAALFSFLFFLTGSYRRFVIPFAIGSTGFTAMIFELILLFGFQIFYGYIFYEVGILITTFLGGMAMGAIIMTVRLKNMKDPARAIMFIEAGIILFAVLLLLVFSLLEVSYRYSPAFMHLLFIALLFISGIITGAEFPLANALYLEDNTVGRTVGIIYGADLLGGWIGGIAGGFILLPILGLLQGCILIAMLKTASLLLLICRRK
ncbi:MAG TPA: fused MFS/spermidine synthase [Syntrophorhabdaceae bacterium]|nr:fused MFS/spermidine synthase [Syntrophorhabdaceae bacterium]